MLCLGPNWIGKQNRNDHTEKEKRPRYLNFSKIMLNEHFAKYTCQQDGPLSDTARFKHGGIILPCVKAMIPLEGGFRQRRDVPVARLLRKPPHRGASTRQSSGRVARTSGTQSALQAVSHLAAVTKPSSFSVPRNKTLILRRRVR